MATVRLTRELAKLESVSWGTVAPMGEDVFQWQVQLIGPEGSPYEGGQFQFLIEFPKTYPEDKPKVTIQTQTYHPSVDPASGGFCLTSVGEWKPTTTMENVFDEIIALLKEPALGAEHPYNAEAAALLKDNADKFNETAAAWTAEHAAP